MIKYTTSSFIEKLSTISPTINVTGKYVNNSTKIACECLACGHQWEATPRHLLSRRGCPKCSIAKHGIHISTAEFSEQLKQKNPTVSLVDMFVNGHKKAMFKCNVCLHTWEAAPYSILAGHGCPKCTRTQTSFSEQYIFYALQAILGEDNVRNRNRSIIGKELDIVIPAYHFAIEISGWFWHKDKLEYDIKKVVYVAK